MAVIYERAWTGWKVPLLVWLCLSLSLLLLLFSYGDEILGGKECQNWNRAN